MKLRIERYHIFIVVILKYHNIISDMFFMITQYKPRPSLYLQGYFLLIIACECFLAFRFISYFTYVNIVLFFIKQLQMHEP